MAAVLATEQTHVADKIRLVRPAGTVKETPDLVMDVTVKGLFQLLEVARESPTVGPCNMLPPLALN